MNFISQLLAAKIKPKYYKGSGVASNPGRLPVQYWRWVICFPQVSRQYRLKIALGMLLLIPSLFVAQYLNPWCGLGMALGSLILAGSNAYKMLNNSYRWACEQFQYGCANPSIVVSVDPYLVAVYTDLTKGDDEKWPVIRIDRQPLERTRKGRFEEGTRVVTVAFYVRNDKLSPRHWVNVTPIVADCVTDDQRAITNLYNTIEPNDWREMDECLSKLPKPYTTGLYWMRPPDTKPDAAIPYRQTVKPSPRWQ